MRLLIAACMFFALSPAALAGGDFVALAVTPGGVWFAGSFGVRELSPTTGRTIWVPEPQSARYPQSIAVAGGAVWVASVANGFVHGTLTRTDLRAHRSRVVLRVPDGSVLYVAAGGGSVYALVGDRRGASVARFDPDGKRSGSWRVRDGGRMAADASGCWVSGSRRLVHIDPRGRLTSIAGLAFGDVATGGGSVWLARETSVVRIDERTGATTTLKTGALHLGGFQHDLAVGDGALWTLDALEPSLQRRDLRTGRIARSVGLGGIPDAVVVTPHAVWVALAVSRRVLRLDPRTLRTELTATAD